MRQVHGVEVVNAGANWSAARADGCVAFAPERVCAVQTADCLPVLLCDAAGSRVGAAHAGWRGLAAGVLESTLGALCKGGPGPVDAAEIMAWIGPGIGAAVYQVGGDVHQAICDGAPGAERFFRSQGGGRWLLDLAAAARHRLRAAGVARIYGGRWCTWSDRERFHSYRRDGGTNRQASFIWLDPHG